MALYTYTPIHYNIDLPPWFRIFAKESDSEKGNDSLKISTLDKKRTPSIHFFW